MMDNTFLNTSTIPTINSTTSGYYSRNPAICPETFTLAVQLIDKNGSIVPGSYARYTHENSYTSRMNGTIHNALPSRLASKRKYNAGPGNISQQSPAVETAVDGTKVIFRGRDSSYPQQLNCIIHPLHCELCGVHMNSPQSAKDHYESKVHDRNLTIWLNKNYTQKGLETPKIKRFLKQGPAGPNAFHCELCDLKLTSLTHANQHYSGRRHRMVANNLSKPSGSGYYNNEGIWIRIASKQSTGSTISNPNKHCGNALVSDEPQISSQTEYSSAANTYESLHCNVCQINVTSSSQMTMHLEGVKHRKKLTLVGKDPSIVQVPMAFENGTNWPNENSILESLNERFPVGNIDWSMYRTPAGSYYCKICNICVGHLAVLQQHLTGKKHMKIANDIRNRGAM